MECSSNQRSHRTPLAALLVAVALGGGCSDREAQLATSGKSASGLAYDLTGAGPPVVLIHGTNLDRRMWEHEAGWLASRARVLRYDLRGQGQSESPVERYSNHADLIGLLDELGLGRAVLVGLSAGAQVALDVALLAPERVDGLVLVSPSLAGYVPSEMPDYLRPLIEALRERDFDRANEVLLGSPIMAVPPEAAERVRTMVEENGRLWSIPYELVEQPSPPALQRLGEIDARTLVLAGGNDVEAIQAQAELLAREIPSARLELVEGGGHLLNLTSAEPFRQALSEFLVSQGN